MFKIYWTPKAQRQLAKVASLKDREAIFNNAGTLKDFPQLPQRKGTFQS